MVGHMEEMSEVLQLIDFHGERIAIWHASPRAINFIFIVYWNKLTYLPSILQLISFKNELDLRLKLLIPPFLHLLPTYSQLFHYRTRPARLHLVTSKMSRDRT